MERQDFEARVVKFEVFAQKRALLYRTRLLAFALLGYGYYGAIVFSTFAVVAFSVGFAILSPSLGALVLLLKAGLPLLVIGFGLLGALRVKWYPPEGIRVTAADAPELFALLAEMEARLGVGSLEAVLLSTDYNAGVIQQPRFGLFGRKNYLLLGLPLLQTLSVEEAKAVIAHEFGHLGGDHSRFQGWIYQVVRTYEYALTHVGKNPPLEKFLRWYSPRLEALSFPLRRANEYEADAVALTYTTPEVAFRALCKSDALFTFHEEFREKVSRSVAFSEFPPATLFADWDEVSGSPGRSVAIAALERALSRPTTHDNTHPSLADRLRALGFEPDAQEVVNLREAISEPVPLERRAARALLGGKYDHFVEQVGYLWCAHVHVAWGDAYRVVQKQRQQLHELEEVRRTRQLTADEACRYSALFEDVMPNDDALPYYRAANELYPAHEGTLFSIARLLLDRLDEAGVAAMKPFRVHDSPHLKIGACLLLGRYYARVGKRDKAGLYFGLATTAARALQRGSSPAAAA